MTKKPSLCLFCLELSSVSLALVLGRQYILGGLGEVSPVLVSFDLVRGRAMDNSL